MLQLNVVFHAIFGALCGIHRVSVAIVEAWHGSKMLTADWKSSLKDQVYNLSNVKAWEDICTLAVSLSLAVRETEMRCHIMLWALHSTFRS